MYRTMQMPQKRRSRGYQIRNMESRVHSRGRSNTTDVVVYATYVEIVLVSIEASLSLILTYSCK